MSMTAYFTPEPALKGMCCILNNNKKCIHRRILLWAPGTRDPYFTSIKKFVDQKTSLKHHGINEIVNFIVQG